MNDKLKVLVDEFTSPIGATIKEETAVGEVKEILARKGYRHVPVVKDNKPIGIVSDRDVNLLQNIDGHEKFLVRDIMVSDPYCVTLGTSLDDVVFEMSSRKIGSALVLNHEGQLDGIFTSIDALNALIEIVRGEV